MGDWLNYSAISGLEKYKRVGRGGANEEAGGSSSRLGNKELVMDQAMGVSKTGKTDRSREIFELEF